MINNEKFIQKEYNFIDYNIYNLFNILNKISNKNMAEISNNLFSIFKYNIKKLIQSNTLSLFEIKKIYLQVKFLQKLYNYKVSLL